MFARRASWELSPNALTRRLEERRRRGLPVLDLSDANPTHFGLTPEAALRAALADASRDPLAGRYDADPRGDAGARAAVAAHHARRGGDVRPEHVILTAGTSEGYAHLFRLLADPGDVVHVPTPGYPLFEHLAGLEGLEARPYPLVPPVSGARWRIDLDALAASLETTSRALLLIDPHNPTGSFVDPADWASLRALAHERGLALVCDEVFADAGLAGPAPPGAFAGAGEGPLHFVVSGASKPLALPQLKVGWIVAAGSPGPRDDALARLEFLADTFLSVSPLLARSLPALLAGRDAVTSILRERIAANRAALERELAAGPARCLPAEAGFAAVIEIERDDVGGSADPATREAADHDAAGEASWEEALALRLLDEHGVFTQPGFWFDLAPHTATGRPAAHLVLSLLLRPRDFARGAAAVRAVVGGRGASER